MFYMGRYTFTIFDTEDIPLTGNTSSVQNVQFLPRIGETLTFNLGNHSIKGKVFDVEHVVESKDNLENPTHYIPPNGVYLPHVNARILS